MLAKLFRPPQSLVGVDVGHCSIKVMEVEAPSLDHINVKHFGMVATPEGALERGQVQDSGKIGAAIREALNQAGIRQRRAALAVPGQVGFVRKLDFPAMPLKEVRAAIDLQPDRYIPFARDGAVYDVYPLSQSPEQKEMAVIVAAAPRQVVTGLMDAAKAAGLMPLTIDVESLTLFRAAVATGQASADRSTAIVDVGGEVAKIALFEGDVPVISRVVDLPVPADPHEARATEELFLDIRRSLEFAMTQLQKPLARVLVTGSVGSDEHLALALTGYLRGFLAHRLPTDFLVEPMQDSQNRVPLSHMLAFGLSLPPELFS